MQIVSKSIIALGIGIGILSQSTSAYAIYSPVISKHVEIARQHVLEAREKNGTGSVMSVVETIKTNDNKDRKTGVTGLPIGAREAFGKIMADAGMDALDALFMPFNFLPSANFRPISNCLRNDIWTLEDMKDSVFNEMLKAYLIGDLTDGDNLKNDHAILENYIRLLKYDGDSAAASHDLFGVHLEVTPYMSIFPISRWKDTQENCEKTCKWDCTQENKDKADECSDKCENTCKEAIKTEWNSCPEGDFVPAFEQLMESMRNLKTLGSGSGTDWGSIKSMAEASGRRKGEDWIKANQMTLTVGGREGGTPQSFSKGGRLKGFIGQFNTEKRIFLNLLGPFMLTKEVKEMISYTQRLQQYRQEEIQYEKTKADALRAFVYHKKFNTTAENGIDELRDVMERINIQIKFGYEGFGKSSGASGLPTLQKQLENFYKQHCGGK